MNNLNFYNGKRIFITGHTGFKGSWLAIMLHKLGAEITGYALDPITHDDNFEVCGLDSFVSDVRGDIRDYKHLNQVFKDTAPEIVFHLAAQPLVITSYEDPRSTYETNVMGTLNVLESVRNCPSVKAVVVITTDKCYENKESLWGYRETDRLGGYDPYSSSKACAELLASSYRNSFYTNIATARAGNVIGGGDWAANRIVPDCIRSFKHGDDIKIRNPLATRPWQHVIEPLYGYLTLAQHLYEEGVKFAEAWNFGPDSTGLINVWKLAELLLHELGVGKLVNCSSDDALHETAFLSLDITKAGCLLGWKPMFSVEETVKLTADWYKLYMQKPDADEMFRLCEKQIDYYFGIRKKVGI